MTPGNKTQAYLSAGGKAENAAVMELKYWQGESTKLITELPNIPFLPLQHQYCRCLAQECVTTALVFKRCTCWYPNNIAHELRKAEPCSGIVRVAQSRH